ncbi:MAG TPA: hypothetical protein VKR21_17220 [Solirubrobacteraceae bacterium]|nr:hypothetical protein [Solirubrobacteraceae bacterium]
MRRSIILGAAVAVLAGAAAAYAASAGFNGYAAKATFSPKAAGSKSKPVASGWHELWSASGTNGHETAPLTKIVTKIYGVRWDGKDFPVCTAAMINNASNAHGWNKVCPKGSQVGGGPVNSMFVPATTPGGPGTPCNPYETVYNAGQGKRTIFFEETPYAPGPQYTCAGGTVTTGAAPAYTETYKVKGGYEVLTTTLPPSVSTSAGGIPGIYASLVKLNVTFPKVTRKVKGKKVSYQWSVGCKAGKRPYSFTFTAQNYQGQSPSTQTTTVAGKAKC